MRQSFICKTQFFYYDTQYSIFTWHIMLVSELYSKPSCFQFVYILLLLSSSKYCTKGVINMIKEIRNMFTYEFASQSKRRLAINLLFNAFRYFILDAAFIAICFLLMLLI